MNLNRISNWVADDYNKNKKKIDMFLIYTDDYISKLEIPNDRFKSIWRIFIDVCPNLRSIPQDNAKI